MPSFLCSFKVVCFYIKMLLSLAMAEHMNKHPNFTFKNRIYDAYLLVITVHFSSVYTGLNTSTPSLCNGHQISTLKATRSAASRATSSERNIRTVIW